jgi:predicted RNA-binding Zn-ribbon protein involved in translation (DUF1610 family)
MKNGFPEEIKVRYKCPNQLMNGYVDKIIKPVGKSNCILDFRSENFEIYSVTVDKCPLCGKKHIITHFRNI